MPSFRNLAFSFQFLLFSDSIKIHTIDLKFQGADELIGSFLIEDAATGLVLIETGPESCRETLLSELDALGFEPKDVSAVFVTHIHLDHSGGAGWWSKELGVPIYVHPKGAKHLIDPLRLEESARSVYGNQFDSLWGSLTPAPAEFVIPIEDGEEVEVAGGLKIRAINSPGHAFHHHCFTINDETDGTILFSGDAAGARLPRSNYISVTSAPPQFHLEYTLETIDRLIAENFNTLYLTHFGQIEDPESHLRDYRDAVELNAEFVRARLAEGMDGDSLQIAYQAFNLEQAFRLNLPQKDWQRYQLVNGTDMCADGLRIYWEDKEQS